MRLVSRITCWLVVGLICALPATAQSVDSKFAPTFGEIVDVRVINLEVVVTQGRERVSGLAGEDFRLLVDGKEVPIEYFTEIEEGRVASGEADAAPVPDLEPGEDVSTRYLVFIDDSFSLRHQRNRVLEELAGQLPLLGAEDHMAVVAFDGRRIEMLTPWTRSRAELERVFEKAGERPAYGLVHRIHRDLRPFNSYHRHPTADTRFGFRSPDFDLPPTGFGFLDGRYGLLTTPHGSRVYNDVVEVVDAAATVLRGFANPPGRKVMLLLSGGWPASRSGFSSTVDYSPRTPYGIWTVNRHLYRPLIDTANLLGYTLYPVDVKGLQSHFGGAQVGSLAEFFFFSELEREREWIEEGALLDIARETGGRALLDSASLKALERAAEDTRSYYWLGFSPTWREDDRRHRVKVEVRGKALKVRSRKSFSDLSPQTEMTMLIESAQLFDLSLPGAEQPLAVVLGEPGKAGYRRVLVPIELTIPLDQLTLFPDSEGFVARIDLRVAATDDRGDRADIPVIPIELRLASADPGGAVVYETSLRMRRRPHKLLISLHDPASGNVMSKRLTFRPPAS